MHKDSSLGIQSIFDKSNAGWKAFEQVLVLVVVDLDLEVCVRLDVLPFERPSKYRYHMGYACFLECFPASKSVNAANKMYSRLVSGLLFW